MTKDELIAKQQLQIEELELKVSEQRAAIKKAHGLVFRINEPLNDNFLKLDKKQVALIFEVELILKSVINNERG